MSLLRYQVLLKASVAFPCYSLLVTRPLVCKAAACTPSSSSNNQTILCLSLMWRNSLMWRSRWGEHTERLRARVRGGEVRGGEVRWGQVTAYRGKMRAGNSLQPLTSKILLPMISPCTSDTWVLEEPDSSYIPRWSRHESSFRAWSTLVHHWALAPRPISF